MSEKFNKTGRNKSCPCNSGKKYKVSSSKNTQNAVPSIK
ncbi:hypothetical protein COB57_05380 [Candidatus Peregrinibacteria bacterium]|nr:MAG: hypothetical protein COB57_05380 [Candidatus Peregrinibacteria bacterium]